MRTLVAGILLVLVTLVFTAGGVVPSADAAVQVHEQLPEEIQENPEEDTDMERARFSPDHLVLSRNDDPRSHLYRDPILLVLIRPPKTHA